jgi:hypothetical protein
VSFSPALHWPAESGRSACGNQPGAGSAPARSPPYIKFAGSGSYGGLVLAGISAAQVAVSNAHKAKAGLAYLWPQAELVIASSAVSPKALRGDTLFAHGPAPGIRPSKSCGCRFT